MRNRFLTLALAGSLVAACHASSGPSSASDNVAPPMARAQDGSTSEGAAMNDDKVVKTDAEWKAVLTPGTYRIMREEGTEAAFTGEYWDNHERGVYVCAACGNPLFTSDTKFESGTGWPSFYAPISDKAVDEHSDGSHFMVRTEIVCHKCGGHLGHVFDDGPKPTGQRYCMNSGAMKFEKK